MEVEAARKSKSGRYYCLLVRDTPHVDSVF
jgi:hypothetical protein